MHMTETKHGLKGSYLTKYSMLCLNIDRFFAYLTGFYGLWLFYDNPNKTIIQVSLPIIGAVCCFVGEQTMNLKLYTGLHCTWHLLAYSALKYVSF